jgi:hypothetical protein
MLSHEAVMHFVCPYDQAVNGRRGAAQKHPYKEKWSFKLGQETNQVTVWNISLR